LPELPPFICLWYLACSCGKAWYWCSQYSYF